MIRKMLGGGTFVVLVMAFLVVGSGSPASAHTQEEAIQAGCGSGYRVVSDGTRALTYRTGEIWGYVYLTYNSSTGMNCVVTRKTFMHGLPTRTLARLSVEGIGTWDDVDDYSHFANVSALGRGRCVRYWGDISSLATHVGGGRWTWGNCS